MQDKYDFYVLCLLFDLEVYLCINVFIICKPRNCFQSMSCLHTGISIHNSPLFPVKIFNIMTCRCKMGIGPFQTTNTTESYKLQSVIIDITFHWRTSNLSHVNYVLLYRKSSNGCSCFSFDYCIMFDNHARREDAVR